jgi:hypothetical protein
MEDVMAKGIRSYGPGKFYTIIDSYVFEMTLDGGADDEASYPQEGTGWFGAIWFDRQTRDRVLEIAAEHNDQLTPKEEELLFDTQAVILFERSDGIVEADWFSNKREAEEAWAGILVDTEEDEDEDEDDEEEDER